MRRAGWRSIVVIIVVVVVGRISIATVPVLGRIVQYGAFLLLAVVEAHRGGSLHSKSCDPRDVEMESEVKDEDVLKG